MHLHEEERLFLQRWEVLSHRGSLQGVRPCGELSDRLLLQDLLRARPQMGKGAL